MSAILIATRHLVYFLGLFLYLPWSKPGVITQS